MYAKVLNLNSEQKIPQSYPLKSLEKTAKDLNIALFTKRQSKIKSRALL